MLEFLRKHTIVVMAAMALVFVGMMFIGGDVQGGSLSGLFRTTYVAVNGKVYDDKDYASLGRDGLSVVGMFPGTCAPLLNFMRSDRALVPFATAINANDEMAIFTALRGIIRCEAERLGLTPSTEEVDAEIQKMPEFADENGKFSVDKYDYFLTARGEMGRKKQEETLRSVMQDVMSLTRIQKLITGDVAIHSEFAEAITASQFQQITVNTAVLKNDNYRPKTEPDEAAIKEFWEKYKENYKNEEARFFTVFYFTPVGDYKSDKANEISNATTETLNVVENNIWEPLNATNGRNMEEAVQTALKNNPNVCTVESKSYTAITQKGLPAELKVGINQSASDGRCASLAEAIFSLPEGSALEIDATAEAIEKARASVTVSQISTVQVLEDGRVALIRAEGATPVKALPYSHARNYARADLIETMTKEAVVKAANDLKANIEKAEAPLKQFETLAKQAGTTFAKYGPFQNSMIAYHYALAGSSASVKKAPAELLEADQVFVECMGINPGELTKPIETVDGLMLVQLENRELENTQDFQTTSTQMVKPLLNAGTQHAMFIDWLLGCVKKYEVYVNPALIRKD